MIASQIAKSKNDECYTPAYAVKPIQKYIKPNSVIWCPFDTEESFFVKVFKELGHTVIATHIWTGTDFFNCEIPECDYIISNPPYSKKTEVIERLFEIGKPFAMLMGIVGLFESQKRFNMFKNNNFEIMYLNKRVSFFQDYKDPKSFPSWNPPYGTVYLCKDILPNSIVFEEINKVK